MGICVSISSKSTAGYDTIMLAVHAAPSLPFNCFWGENKNRCKKTNGIWIAFQKQQTQTKKKYSKISKIQN